MRCVRSARNKTNKNAPQKYGGERKKKRRKGDGNFDVELEFLGKDSMLFKQNIEFGAAHYNVRPPFLPVRFPFLPVCFPFLPVCFPFRTVVPFPYGRSLSLLSLS